MTDRGAYGTVEKIALVAIGEFSQNTPLQVAGKGSPPDPRMDDTGTMPGSCLGRLVPVVSDLLPLPGKVLFALV
jgi:hypothetical protein